MAVGPDFRLRAGAADEGIVGRHADVAGQPDHLAEVVRQVLRLIALVAFAKAEPQHDVKVDHETAAEMEIGRASWRERVGEYVKIAEGAVQLKKKKDKKRKVNIRIEKEVEERRQEKY